MKRFIRYLYEYQDGKKIRNTGFVKVEEQEYTAIIQVYGREFSVGADQSLKIYLFLEMEPEAVGIFMGKIEGVQSVFGYKLSYTAEDVGGPEKFQKIQGLLLTAGDGEEIRYYSAVWNEEPTDVRRIILEEKRTAPEETENSVEQEEERRILEENVRQQSEESADKEEKKHDIIYKITRKELAGLPRKEWKLANNHFLLHGYYNYHHLISFEKEGSCWIGVPGLYFPGEQRAASAFGFGQFMKPSGEEINLEEYEIEDEEHFGYWCRQVGAVIRTEAKEKEYAEDIDRGRKIHERGDQAGEEGMEN